MKERKTPEKIVFILSTGRTGTKTLAKGLNGGEVNSPHQPRFSRFLTIASNFYLHGWLPKPILTWFVKWMREPQVLNADCRYYIQVFSLDYFPAKIIGQKYPNVSMLHIIRDPRTFVPSYLNWIHTRFKSWLANKFVPGWHPSGFFTGEISWGEWRKMDEFQRVCWHWVYKNKLIARLFANDERYKRIRFEDLFLASDLGGLRGILTFTEIPYLDRYEQIVQRKENVSLKSHFPAWDQWTLERQEQLLRICGGQMRRFGYL